jgi:hypothetical protein
MEITIRHAESYDYEAIHRIFSSPRVIEGTHLRYAFRDGEYVDAYSMARVR